MTAKTLSILSAENVTMLLRVLGALAIGAAIGLERTFHGRPAGFARMRWSALLPRC